MKRLDGFRILPALLRHGTKRDLGSTNGTTTITSGATLDVGANSINLGLERIFVSGVGIGGNGAIINSSGSGTFVGPNVALVTMTGNTTFGGTGRWDLRSSNTANPLGASLSTGGNAYKLTKTGPNGVYLPGVSVDPNIMVAVVFMPRPWATRMTSATCPWGSCAG